MNEEFKELVRFEVERLRLEPGDVLLVRWSMETSQEEAHAALRRVKEVVETTGVKRIAVVGMPVDFSLERMNQEQLADFLRRIGT